MTKLAIATVEACNALPFTANPFIALVLASQVGTAERYVRTFPADASFDDMDAEARALEMTGEITQADLDADWTFDRDAVENDEIQAEADTQEAGFMSEGAPTVEDNYDLEPVN